MAGGWSAAMLGPACRLASSIRWRLRERIR
jgi:hypothetical protein